MADSPVSTKNVYPYYAKSNVDKAGKSTAEEKNKYDFMKILIAQMKYQNPADPVKDKDFIAQVAQMTNLEQMKNMASELKLMRQSLGISSSLIGKEVEWKVPNIKNNEEVKIATGVVESIVIKDGSQYALIKGAQINLDSILKISNPGAITS